MKINTIKNIAVASLVLVSFLCGYFTSDIQKDIPIATSNCENLIIQRAGLENPSFHNQVPNDLSTTFIELKNEIGKSYDNNKVLDILQEKYKTKVEIIERMKSVLTEKQHNVNL